MISIIGFLLLSIAIILVCCELFCNSIEWLGNHLGLGEGAVGSLLAAVGTALPETSIPLIAILLVGGEAAHEIGIGAILGAPFMLSTAAFCVTGTAVAIFSAGGRRSTTMLVDASILQRDIGYFVVVYCLAVVAAFIASHAIKVAIALLLLGLYGFYVYRTLQGDKPMECEIGPLHFHRKAAEPCIGWNVYRTLRGGESVKCEACLLHFHRQAKAQGPCIVWVVLQIVVALAGIIVGGRLFVHYVEQLAEAMHISPLVLSLLIAPVATELPEKFNSVIWVGRSRDTLAMGNITGAMTFQSCIPVAVGLVFTAWELTSPALASALIALGSSSVVYGLLRIKKSLNAYVLMCGGLFYLAFVGYVVFLL